MEHFPDELILSIRTSQVFRTSVYFIDFVLLIALTTTVLATRQLHTRQVFSSSTNYLLIFDFVAINIHNLSYVFIQNWSLYRSLFHSQNVNDMMFRSEECWPHHVANEYTKTVTLFVQFALIINRVSVTAKPSRYSEAKYAVLLSIATLIASAIFTANEHARGPFLGMRTTSCFRESDVTVDLHTQVFARCPNRTFPFFREHIVPYIVICSITIVCSLVLIAYVKISQNKKTYDVASQYMRKESMISTIAVVIIGLIQLAAFSLYDFSLTIFSHYAEQNPSEQDTNVIGWLYTGPFNAVVSPSAVLFYVFIIKRNRKKDISSLTKHKATHSDHFQQLSVFWNKT